MKQHITVEQLNELSERGKRRLWGSIENNRWLYTEWIDWKKKDGITTHQLPLLSIGQMIELLGKRLDERLGNEWWYKVFCSGYGGELCNVLWEALKEFLDE